jgi:DNA modification methylase
MIENNSTKLITWLPSTRTCNCSPDALNCLTKREWLRNQVPIWWFNAKELNTKFDSFSHQRHPAVFPTALAKRVIKNYTHENETLLDIFSGVGTNLYAAQNLKRNCVVFELNETFAAFTNRRLALKNDQYCSDPVSTHRKTNHGQHIQQVCTDARDLLEYLKPRSIDLVFTSPPYWDLLKQPPSRRNLKSQKYLKKNYSDDRLDLSNDSTLHDFSKNIKDIFEKVKTVLNPGKRCIINTGDYRRKGKYISLSSIYINIMQEIGFELKNTIIWDRRKEYDIGIFSYPNNFIVNNGMFEYILEFKN